MRVVALHKVNTTTKVARFTAPLIQTQDTPNRSVLVELFDENAVRTGYMLATEGGLVLLADAAIDQYEPLHRGDPDAH